MIEAPAKKKPPRANGPASENEKDYESAQTITDTQDDCKPWDTGAAVVQDADTKETAP